MVPLGNCTLKPSSAGFLLLDSSIQLLHANQEAVRILRYQTNPHRIRPLDGFLPRKVLSQLLIPPPSPSAPVVQKLRSGKRLYLCRAFWIDSSRKSALQPMFAILMERSDRLAFRLTHLAEQFHLTKREGETLEWLVQGLTGKQIAHRMQISPNTVKAFLRLTMVKMGVFSRPEIMSKVIESAF